MPATHTALPRNLVNREQVIVNLCRGRRVLHLGCTSSPNLEWNMEHGTLLHVSISKVCNCLGVDIDSSAVSRLHDAYHIHNVLCGDAEHLEELKRGQFDVVIAGELIEHLSNPGRFLEGCKSVLHSDGSLVITTVNAFCLRRILRVPFGAESVHPDHVCYYSHSTLQSLAHRYGFHLDHAYSHAALGYVPFVARTVERLAAAISPNLCEGILHIYGTDHPN